MSRALKGLGAVATVLVIIGAISSVATLSVGAEMLLKVVGLGGQSEDVKKLKNVVDDVKRVCQLGEDANDHSRTETFSRKINFTTISEGSEDFEPDQPQYFRALDLNDGKRLMWSSRREKIQECQIRIEGGKYVVFEKNTAYEITVENDGTDGGQPKTKVSVSTS